MTGRTSESASGARPLPENPNLEWLRKESKRLLGELRRTNPDAKLADAQFDVAKTYGFPSWRALKAHVDSLSIDGQLFDAARECKVETLAALLDAHPDKLYARKEPYQWTMLHTASQAGCVAAVELLLARGVDPNTREEGDNTYAMHWAAAAGQPEIVRRLIDAGGDVIGEGDDHELQVIGWATCWEGTDTQGHRDVVNLLLRNGAKHHIFSAVAMNLADEVRRIVAADPSALNRRLSRNENHQTPLHFAVRFNRPEMLSVLLDLGADPLVVDGTGQPIACYVTSKDADRPVMERIHSMVKSEITSAERGLRTARATTMDLIACLSLRDLETANRLTTDNPELLSLGGALHLMARRNDLDSLKWLLDQGANPNALWRFWDADVTLLHLAAWSCAPDIVRLLLGKGADPKIQDSKYKGDALDWAEHFECNEIVKILKEG